MITMIVELSCDHDGCDTAYAPSIDEMTSVTATRVGATIAGWARRDGRDYCPGHASTESDMVARLRDLAGKGRNDTEIAQLLGHTRQWVQKLRSRHGIEAGVRPGRPLTRRTQPRQEIGAASS